MYKVARGSLRGTGEGGENRIYEKEAVCELQCVSCIGRADLWFNIGFNIGVWSREFG